MEQESLRRRRQPTKPAKSCGCTQTEQKDRLNSLERGQRIIWAVVVCALLVCVLYTYSMSIQRYPVEQFHSFKGKQEMTKELENKIEQLSSEISKLDNRVSKLEKLSAGGAVKGDPLEDVVGEVKAELQTKILGLESRMSRLEQCLSTLSTAEGISENTSSSLTHESGALNDTFNSELLLLQNQLIQLHLDTHKDDYAFTLNKYSKRKKDNSSFFSPEMHTHIEGYTFKLKIDPNDRGFTAKIYSVRSEHKDKLRFPARISISLELVDQLRKKDHVTREVKWTAYEHEQSYSHDIPFSLNPTPYLDYDNLSFKVTRITLLSDSHKGFAVAELSSNNSLYEITFYNCLQAYEWNERVETPPLYTYSESQSWLRVHVTLNAFQHQLIFHLHKGDNIGRFNMTMQLFETTLTYMGNFNRTIHFDIKEYASKDTLILKMFKITTCIGICHEESLLRKYADSSPYDITFYDIQEMLKWSDYIDSPPMYTHAGGYKFKLTLNVDEHNEEYSWVWIEVHLLEGENDINLNFKQMLKINIQLVSPHTYYQSYNIEIRCVIRQRGMARLCEERLPDNYAVYVIKSNSLLFKLSNIIMYEGVYAELHGNHRAESPPYDITFYKFQEMTEWNEYFESPPMYTHSGGYKFVLSFHFKARSRITVSLVEGENDGNLDFEDLFTMTLQILSTYLDQDHYTATLRCDIHGYHGIVCVHYLPDSLDTRRYIKNNSFQLSIPNINFVDRISYAELQVLEHSDSPSYDITFYNIHDDIEVCIDIESPPMLTHPGGYEFKLRLTLCDCYIIKAYLVQTDVNLHFKELLLSTTLQLSTTYSYQNPYKKTLRCAIGKGKTYAKDLCGLGNYIINNTLLLRVSNITLRETGYAELKQNDNSPPYDITFYNVQEAKEWEQKIDSPPMYTHPGGYKFKLSLNMYRNLPRAYMDMELVAGENDACLDFKERLTITLQLLSQNSSLDHTAETQRGIVKPRYKGRVHAHPSCIRFFISNINKYITRNSIQIQVLKIEL